MACQACQARDSDLWLPLTRRPTQTRKPPARRHRDPDSRSRPNRETGVPDSRRIPAESGVAGGFPSPFPGQIGNRGNGNWGFPGLGPMTRRPPGDWQATPSCAAARMPRTRATGPGGMFAARGPEDAELLLARRRTFNLNSDSMY